MPWISGFLIERGDHVDNSLPGGGGHVDNSLPGGGGHVDNTLPPPPPGIWPPPVSIWPPVALPPDYPMPPGSIWPPVNPDRPDNSLPSSKFLVAIVGVSAGGGLKVLGYTVVDPALDVGLPLPPTAQPK
jgi:hypothetical protein